MLGLISALGTRHPPTADDAIPLGTWRDALGRHAGLLILGFTPEPMSLPGH